jgi:uncharacterized protein YybS (DUF2232 family)
VLALSACTVALFATAGFVPVFGILMSLLAPTPLLLVVLRHGVLMGILALGLAALALALVFGGLQSTIFLAEYGVMAIAMAGAIRRQWSVEKTLLVAIAVPVMASGIVLAVLFASADLQVSTMQQHFEADLNQAFEQFLTAEGGASGETLRAYVQEALKTVLQVLPALFVLSTAVGALLNYGLVRIIWRRWGGKPPLPEVTLTRWKAPEACVWVLIASGICYVVPLPGMQVVGVNMLLLISPVYLVQGLGVMVFYLNRTSVPAMLRSLTYIFLVIQPLLLVGVTAFGLFDLWFDFRRTGNKREETQ